MFLGVIFNLLLFCGNGTTAVSSLDLMEVKLMEEEEAELALGQPRV